jgi:hypothetical protein
MTDSLGSTLFALTWKLRTTPAGRSIYALRASVRRTSDSGCGGWPTPVVPNGGRQPAGGMSPTGMTPDGKKRQVDLNYIAKLASWPTATVHDAERGGQMKRAMGETRHGSNLQDFAMLASWPTPCQQDGPKGGPGQGADRLPAAAALASWGTPSVSDSKNVPYSYGNLNREGKPYSINLRLFGQAQLAVTGPTQTGSTAATASGGQLNPAHSRWLMGLPPVWDDCAVTAMPSTRKQRRPSSPPTLPSEVDPFS